MRLDKLLGQAGFGSRGQVKKFIRSQQVRVDDELARTGNKMWILAYRPSPCQVSS